MGAFFSAHRLDDVTNSLANVMEFSEDVKKDIAMYKMQRPLQKRMQPICLMGMSVVKALTASCYRTLWKKYKCKKSLDSYIEH